MFYFHYTASVSLSSQILAFSNLRKTSPFAFTILNIVQCFCNIRFILKKQEDVSFYVHTYLHTCGHPPFE